MSVTPRAYVYSTQVISQKAFDNHMTLYKGYVDKINEIDKILVSDPQADKANATYSHYRGLKESGTFAIDAIILHELYFDNMGYGKTSPNLKTTEVLRRSFGSVSQWSADFTACAKAARGWACLVYEQRSQSFRNIMLDSHNTGVVVAAFPLVVLDMYEHAYFMDYGTNKADYIQNFIASINWDVVAERMTKLYTER